VFPSAGSVSSLVTAFAILQNRTYRLERRQRRMVVISILYAVFNGIGVYAWGARALLVVIVAQSVVGYFTFRPASTKRLSQGIRPRIFLALFLAFGLGMTLVFGLRVYRDKNLSGEVSGNIGGQSIVRQLSVATNSVYYDAYLLAVRDWPSKHRFRGGTDIFNGSVGVIPRAIWAGKPEIVAPGAWFRQVYEPKNVNGWPMGSAGVWYLNFGRVGLVIGGLITGLVVAAAARSFPNTRTNPLAFVMAVAIGFWVIGDGVDGQFVAKWGQWVLPMIFLIPLMQQSRRAPTTVAVRN
jgi:oligosaccharide repeat unit polymerase